MEGLQIGEYVRTYNGLIGKIVQITENGNYAIRIYNGAEYVVRAVIVKHSKNKIDLIEIGDYANGEYVYELGNSENGDKWIHTLNGHLYYEKDIETIWTKEQLKSIEYNIN